MNVLNQKPTIEVITQIYNTPILDLIFKGAVVHRKYHDPSEIQVCTLLSIKTGGCPEDCSYCSQSAHFDTKLIKEKLMDEEKVLEAANQAKADGSTRFCMGAAWRNIRDNDDFEQVLKMVEGVSNLDMQVCVTLGMLTANQAIRLKNAGLYAYNHNLDTGEKYYPNVVTTRIYEDRLETIRNVQKAGISVCCGGILGLGEKDADRIDLLHTLSNMDKHPESIPINALVPIEGTPFEKNETVNVWDMLRMIATARILMAKAMIRLSAGRDQMNEEQQALCFLAGANSIFSGDKLLTTPHPGASKDANLMNLLNLKPRSSNKLATSN